MATKPATSSPPAVTITADSWFHYGWLHGMLGIPEHDFEHDPATDLDVDSYVDGYSMARETRSPMTQVFARAVKLGQLKIE